MTEMLPVPSVKQPAMNLLGLRAAGSVMVGACWLAFIVLFLAFFAGEMNFWPKAAVFIASGSTAGGLTAFMWIRWALG